MTTPHSEPLQEHSGHPCCDGTITMAGPDLLRRILALFRAFGNRDICLLPRSIDRLRKRVRRSRTRPASCAEAFTAQPFGQKADPSTAPQSSAISYDGMARVEVTHSGRGSETAARNTLERCAGYAISNEQWAGRRARRLEYVNILRGWDHKSLDPNGLGNV